MSSASAAGLGLQGDSLEYATLRNHVEDLELALKDNITPIIEKLNREHLIKSDIYDRLKGTMSSSTKASDIVTSIVEMVKLNPKNYHQFMRILNSTTHYKDICTKLNGGEFAAD